jgi:hypothetical protein
LFHLHSRGDNTSPEKCPRAKELIKHILYWNRPDGSVPGLIEMTKIASRTRRLGEFVARQLSGIDPSNSICIDQQLELHLRSIRDSIENNIVPLGLLRVGSSLERSLLFKVIADRIGLPASLVRGRYGKSWVEIAVPTVSVDFTRP